MDIEELLISWGLPQLVARFKDNLIDEESFPLLEDEVLKDLIPEVGLRVKFLSKYKIYKAPIDIYIKRCVDVTQEIPSSPSASSDALSTESFVELGNNLSEFEDETNTIVIASTCSLRDETTSSCTASTSSHSTSKKVKYNGASADLLTLLESSSKGQYVLAYYKRNNILSRDSRQKLVDVIVEDRLSNNITARILATDFSQLADAIVELFPNEDKSCYFTIVEIGNRKRACGKLFVKYYNLRRKFFQVGLLIKQDKSKPQEGILLTDDEENYDDLLAWLKNSVSPLPTVIDYWAKTFRLRRNLLSEPDTTIGSYLKQFPCLTSNSGHELLENDFATLYPGSELMLFASFDTISSAVYEVYQSTNDKVLLQKLKEFYSEETYDIKSLKFFMLLPYMLPTVTACKSKEGQYRPSKLEVLRSFILHITDISKLKEEVEIRKQRLSRFKLNLQPQIVAVGPSLEVIEQYYVTVNEQLYFVQTALKAVDICFKIFFALNARYPVESEQIWIMIQKLFYKISTKFDKKFVNVNGAINDINKFLNSNK